MAGNNTKVAGAPVSDDDTSIDSGELTVIGPSKWAQPGQEAPGGSAIDDDGNVNLDRFDIGPETEISLTWWNKRLIWQTRREPTSHEVVVARITENIWRVHLLMAVAAIVVGMAALVLFSGLSPLWALLLGVALGAAAYGALLVEQRIGAHRVGMEKIYVLDNVVWSNARQLIERDYLPKTKSGQRALYDAAVELKHEEYERTYGDPNTGKVGKTWFNPEAGSIERVPKFAMDPEQKKGLLSKTDRLSPDAVADKIAMLLNDHSVLRSNAKLRSAYAKNPKLAVNKGRGVLDCGCVACAFNKERGVVPPLSGAEAARAAATARARRARLEGAAQDSGLATGALRAAALGAMSRLTNADRAQEEVFDDETGTLRSPQAIAAARKLRESQAAQQGTAEEAAELIAGDSGPQRAPADLEALDRGAAEPVETKREARKRLAAERAALRGDTQAPRWPWLVAGVIVVGIVALVSVIVMRMGQGDQQAPRAELPPPSATASSSAPASATPTTTPVPPGERAGVPLTFGPGDAGNQLGGAGAIAAYEHAYYVLRDAVAAQNLYAPGARGDITTLKTAIEANPTGTGYKLVVTPVKPGDEYDIELTIMWPNTPPLDVKKKFFVTYLDGKFYLLRSENR